VILPTSTGVARIPHLGVFLNDQPTAFVGWGSKASGRRAQWIARKLHMRSLALEDGFLRSVGRSDPPLSLIADDLGIYYDASAPSRLEQTIASPVTHAQRTRSEALIDAWRTGRVSKYNHAPEYAGPLPDRYVLVVDQTLGDASISRGWADASTFTHMLDAAIAENTDATVLVKVHPDIATRGKLGHFDIARIARHPRIVVLADSAHPTRLIEQAEVVYTVTSQMGFEALIWGRRVRCFGMPFYAGWGLSEDILRPPARRGAASLAQLVHAALIALPRYIDPQSGQRCEVEVVLRHIAAERAAAIQRSK
jgi:capsular polysaccharide export protein